MREEKTIELDAAEIEKLENEIDLKAYFDRRDEETFSLETILAKTAVSPRKME